MPLSENSNMGMNEDVRTFSFGPYTIPVPNNGEEIVCTLAALRPFRILRVWRECESGECELHVLNDGEVVEFDDADTSHGLDVVPGATVASEPDSTDPNNYTVDEFGRLSFLIEDTDSDCTYLRVQIDAMWLQENDAGPT